VSSVTASARRAPTKESAAGSLILLREAKVATLLRDRDAPDRYEASGVLALGGALWVVFDNDGRVARIDPALRPGDPGHHLLPASGGLRGYEDIAHDGERCYVLVESAPYPDGGWRARVHVLDRSFRCVRLDWLPFPLERPNKGLEGLTCVRRRGRTHLLAMCEGNRCAGGREGRRPGGGRVHVFAPDAAPGHGDEAGPWRRVATMRLPPTLWFEDYSGISVDGDRVAVVSQQSSALWVGRLAPHAWEVRDGGTTYLFPRDARGRRRYATVEGVAWLDSRTVAVVSDRADDRSPRRERATDQSVHVFALPSRAEPVGEARHDGRTVAPR
jgi:hypothetical protein